MKDFNIIEVTNLITVVRISTHRLVKSCCEFYVQTGEIPACSKESLRKIAYFVHPESGIEDHTVIEMSVAIIKNRKEYFLPRWPENDPHDPVILHPGPA